MHFGVDYYPEHWPESRWETEPDPELIAAFMRVVIAEAGISSLGDTPEGVELARRRTEKTDYLFALNHTARGKILELPRGWKPLVGGPVLGPYGFSVFAVEREGRPARAGLSAGLRTAVWR